MDDIERAVAVQLTACYTSLLGKNKSTAEDLRRQSFQVYLSDPGSVVIGGVYFCGLKPYGAASRAYPPPQSLPEGFTTYRDAPTGSPFYPRARTLIRYALDLTLGKEATLEQALCTNWYFQRAADTKQLRAFGLSELEATEVHRSLLDKFLPKLVLCVGNGPISSYRGMLDLHGVETSREERYLGRSYLRAATSTGGRKIVGVPHLSRYPVEESLLRFIRQQFGAED